MAKRTGGGRGGDQKSRTTKPEPAKAAPPKPEPDWRLLLAAAVVEHGTRRVVGPHVLAIPRRALRAAADAGKLTETELPNGDRILTYTPPR